MGTTGDQFGYACFFSFSKNGHPPPRKINLPRGLNPPGFSIPPPHLTDFSKIAPPPLLWGGRGVGEGGHYVSYTSIHSYVYKFTHSYLYKLILLYSQRSYVHTHVHMFIQSYVYMFIRPYVHTYVQKNIGVKSRKICKTSLF